MRPEMSSEHQPGNCEPGIYGARDDERWLSDFQLHEIATHVRSIESIWTRFSKITADDWIEDQFGREIAQAIIDYLRSRQLMMTGMESVRVFRLLREMAEQEQRA